MAVDWKQRRADLKRVLENDFEELLGRVSVLIQEKDALIAASAERIETGIKGVRQGEAEVLRQHQRDRAALVAERERIERDREPVEAELASVQALLKQQAKGGVK